LFANDATKLVAAFGGMISQSAPHIYLSALSFAPKNSLVARKYRPEFCGAISLTAGQVNDWPAIIRVIKANVRHVCFLPDGKRIISNEYSGLNIQDAETGERVFGPLHSYPMSAFSLHGSHIACPYFYAYTISVWDSRNGEKVTTLNGHEQNIRSIAFSPDGKSIASADDYNLFMFNIETGRTLLTKDIYANISHKPHSFNNIAFSEGGSRIIYAIRNNILMLDGHTGDIVRRLPIVDDWTTMAFSPDRRMVAYADEETICVTDLEADVTTTWPMGHMDKIFSLAFSPDQSRIASGSADQTIRIWDAETGEAVGTPIKGHTSAVRSVAFSPDGNHIVSSSLDGTIRIWHAEAGESISSPVEVSPFTNIAVTSSTDGMQISCVSSNHNILTWDADSSDITELVMADIAQEPGDVAFISPDRKQVAYGNRGVIVTEKEIIQIGEPFDVAAFSPDGRRIAIIQLQHLVIRDARTGKVTTNTKIEAPTAAAFSADGQRVLVTSIRTIWVLNAETGEPTLGPLEDDGWVISVAFSPDGRYFASGSSRAIRIWDAGTGETTLGPLQMDSYRWINSVAFSPDSRMIVFSSDDNTIKVRDARTGESVVEPLYGHEAGVSCVSFLPDGRRIASASRDGSIRIWEITSNGGEQLEKGGFTDTSKFEDGWIFNPPSSLLFWVPPWNRRGLYWPRTTDIIGEVATKLDLHNFVHGEEWAQCKRRE
jgi:WD40 repeat protein